MNENKIKKPVVKSSVEKVVDDHINGSKKSLGRRFRGYLLAGILVTAPISITIYLTYIFLTFVDTRVAKILPDDWYHGFYGGTTIPGLGLIVAILFFIIVGWFATNVLGRLLIKLSEYIVNRMPVIRTLYGATKQIFETVMASKSDAFREPVMLEYPRRGVWSIGFVTGRTEGEVQRLTEEDTINVFVPTTPNPTSGYLLFVPKKELKFLSMTVEEAVKLVVSAGIITPPDRQEDKKKPAVKKVVAKKKTKTSTKKTASKKPAAKKVATKSVSKKAPAKKTTAKIASKKVATKKTVTKKAAAKTSAKKKS